MSTPTPSPDVEAIRTALRQVIDPEVGVNIVDLGLVYGIDATPEKVRITMTMTSPACPMADMIIDDIDAVLDALLPEGLAVDVQLVWDPPWNPGMMKTDARRHFGW
ncbi:MAG TPA: metal-sulfur cluster assembly factor [Rhodocyclaceae bacterium]|nr:metal-sulfur cluster assembly factor [Rhodocyclaceae bacterium]